MSDVTRIITLGIGPAATIDGFVLSGLNPATVTYTGLRSTAIKREISFDVDNRPVMYKSRAILLESGIGTWLFEDLATMVWEILTGDEGEVKRGLSGVVQ